ncbi:spiroplasma plectrovirus-related protein [Spiroplasma phoeniceum P40]|uniref:Spiroplasma plectrovirus-related protein n=1 Tax=Spiroplasma phoeniceum P40 TaxID=1276259 RepID=A0A345DR29_9MOLU|nr:spiroplasma plectrovirus-related protein [Spiroplasma phoeniceum P40]
MKQDNWKLNTSSTLQDNKWYIAIVNELEFDDFSIIKFNFKDKLVWSVGVPYHIINGVWYIVNSYYRWDGVGEPQIPTIDKNSCEINYWLK